jgi:demethylmenaquinone methyltransferase/2-methoxy-6-polyprenyl-1,4-benzoquinol methylase
MTPTANPRTAFFDGISELWDGWDDQAEVARKLSAGLQALGVGAEETVVDVGCGTGNLTRALVGRLSPAGRVHAVDISPRMIERARGKVPDPRVSWHVEDARRLSIADPRANRVLCCSVWPHFDERHEVARELQRILKPGGALHVWHLLPRERINEIHAGAGESVRADVLEPASQTAELLAAVGFSIVTASESEAGYLVTAVKPHGGS